MDGHICQICDGKKKTENNDKQNWTYLFCVRDEWNLVDKREKKKKRKKKAKGKGKDCELSQSVFTLFFRFRFCCRILCGCHSLIVVVTVDALVVGIAEREQNR